MRIPTFHVMNSHKGELRQKRTIPKNSDLLSDDPFELAIEEASLRVLQSLRDTFHVEKVHFLQSNFFGQLKGEKAEGFTEVLKSQCRQGASLRFAIREHQNDDVKHNGFTEVLESQCRQGASSRFAATSLKFSPVIREHQNDDVKHNVDHPSVDQLLSHPLALFSYMPKDAALFIAGAFAGATARTVTAPLDRIKLLMQVHSVKTTQESATTSIGILEAALKIGKEEGLQGFWKGNLPQVLRLVPYSAIQLTSYELYKKLFKGDDKELSVIGRLAAGACAGMTSTLVTYPLDVLRLRLAVDPSCKSMLQVATTMLREEGLSSFYGGLGPSLLGIAPYIALNFCAFDLIKNSLPEEIRKTPAASFLTALLSSSLATTSCYPLDTIRRQMQMKGTPYQTVRDAFSGILAKDGVIGLYRGFVPNALKSLPNSSIRLTTFDTAKSIYSASQQEFQKLVRERQQGPKSES